MASLNAILDTVFASKTPSSYYFLQQIASLGAFILFMGFPAFNGGSLLSITGPGESATISLIFVNTILAGSSGAVVALVVFKFYNRLRGRDNYWSLLVTVNAALTGAFL